MMESQSDPPWSQTQTASFANMVGLGDHDFADLVDLDLGVDLQALEFPIYGSAQDNSNKLPGGIDLNLLQDHNRQQQHPHVPHTSSEPVATAQALFDFSMPSAVSFDSGQGTTFAVQQQIQSLSSQSIVPPTPNSVEMHGDAARYLQQMDARNRAVLEQQYHMRKGDGSTFTPLVSPAVTPHDGRFQLQEFTVPPGAYFSPLTSPALGGQQGPYHSNNSTTSVSTSSPVDPDVDMFGDSTITQQASNKSKSRKRPGSPRDAVAAGNRVRQSPIPKPRQRGKKALSSVIPTKEVQNLLDQARHPATSPTSPSIPRSLYTQPGSGTDSISPEPLSEALMGPPPKPASAKPSPALTPQSRSDSHQNIRETSGAVPATPASLMRMPSSNHRDADGLPTNSPTIVGAKSMLEDLVLPEPTIEARSPLERAFSGESGEATPRLSARKTPKLGPSATPGSSALSSSSATGEASPVGPPASPAAGKKGDPKGRANKKRGSVGNSSMVSPALRPKISPGIKPLLPEGVAITEDSHTLFLATRSNYQNLIEGTQVPGVNYPQELSTNLTSKRTSHKIAEQGRRNRINYALQEMHSLLPNSGSQQLNLKEGEEDDEKGGKGAAGRGGGSSKAATVESAIEYIKFMQQRNQDLELQQKSSSQEIDELKKKIMDMEKKLGGISTSDSAPPPATRSKPGKRTAAREPKD